MIAHQRSSYVIFYLSHINIEVVDGHYYAYFVDEELEAQK